MPTELPIERTIREPGSLELDPSGDGVALEETSRLIASNRVEGTSVYDRTGRHIGDIHNFMVDKITGQVAYVVMSFGGFFGLGENYHPLPWRALTYDPVLGGYVIDIDRDKMAGAPRHDGLADPFVDDEYGRRVDAYYRTAPSA